VVVIEREMLPLGLIRYTTTLQSGRFTCPDCTGHQIYQRKVSVIWRTWWYLVPLFPVSGKNRFLECQNCKSSYPEAKFHHPVCAGCQASNVLAERQAKGLHCWQCKGPLGTQGKEPNWQPEPPTARLRTAGIILAIASILLALGAEVVLAYWFFGAREMANWPTTTGTVTHSRIETRSLVKTTYVARITYTYEVYGRQHTSSAVDQAGKDTNAQSDAEALQNKYPVGARAKVYYDPLNPSRAYLEPDNSSTTYLLLLIPLILLQLVALSYLGYVVFRPRPRALAKEMGEGRGVAPRFGSADHEQPILDVLLASPTAAAAPAVGSAAGVAQRASEPLEALPTRDERLQSNPGQFPRPVAATEARLDSPAPPVSAAKPNYALRVVLLLGGVFATLSCCGVGGLGLAYFLWDSGGEPRATSFAIGTKRDDFFIVGPVGDPPRPDPIVVEQNPRPVPPAQRAPINPPTLTGKGVSKDWTVVFRSHDPSIWNRDVNQGEQHFAKPLSSLPAGIRYLRMRHDAAYVIIETSNGQLERQPEQGQVVWNGTNRPLHGAYHLGIIDMRRDKFFDHGAICVHATAPRSGWGFGHLHFEAGKQGYCWNGLTIDAKVLEIAVKPGELTPEEQEQLLPLKPKTEPIKPAQLAGAGVSKDWSVIFCSADPSLWDREVNEGPMRQAREISGVSNDIRYLRIRRDADYVIVAITKDKLRGHGDDSRYGWDGGNLDLGNARHLGVYDRTQTRIHPGDICVFTRNGVHFQGWGFGHNAHVNDDQNYSWNCTKVAPCVFEISVKTGELTAEETKKLLDHSIKMGPIEPLQLAGAGISKDWEVVFRSANPRIWDSDVNKGDNNFAKRLDGVPNDMRYLRIRRNSEYAIVELTKQQIKEIRDDGRYGWSGRGEDDSGAIHLGIYDLKNECKHGDICIRSFPWVQGWGFGHIHFRANVQGYCWNGKGVDPCVFEIAVKKGDLTEAETKQIVKRQQKPVAPIKPENLEGAGVSKDWAVIFCSADPSIWNSDTNRDANHRALALSGVPEDIAYLRLRKDDDYVIVPMTKERLANAGVTDGYGWEGRNRERGPGVRCLGIYGQDMRISRREEVIVGFPFHRGWGFGGPLRPNGDQGYSWEGKPIEAGVFEIAVKKGQLTDDEQKKLLRKNP